MSFNNPVDGLVGNAHLDMAGIHVQADVNLASAGDMFDVTGTVRIDLIYGVVTTVVATTTTILFRRETGTVDMCAATTITTDAVGTMYMWSGDPGEVLSGAGAPVIGFATTQDDAQNKCIFGLSGASEVIEAVLDGAGTGVIRWHLFYTPLEVGAKVVAS